MYYLRFFFFYSILGYFLESLVTTQYESGILYGYWTPIYGIGVCLIIGIYHAIKKWLHPNKWVLPVLLFFSSAFFLALMELIGGYLIQFLFHRVFWNYQNHHFPIGLYTSLDMALVWGIASIVVIYILKPLTEPLIKKIPKTIIFILLGLFILDILLTVNNKIIQ